MSSDDTPAPATIGDALAGPMVGDALTQPLDRRSLLRRGAGWWIGSLGLGWLASQRWRAPDGPLIAARAGFPAATHPGVAVAASTATPHPLGVPPQAIPVSLEAISSTSIGSMEASAGVPPPPPPDDGRFHLWFNLGSP